MCTMNMPCVQDIYIYILYIYMYITDISIYFIHVYLQYNYCLRKATQELTRATHTISESCWNVGRVQLVAQS